MRCPERLPIMVSSSRTGIDGRCSNENQNAKIIFSGELQLCAAMRIGTLGFVAGSFPSPVGWPVQCRSS